MESNSNRHATHYEVRDQRWETVLTLDGFECVYEDMGEAQDAAVLTAGRVVAVLSDGTEMYL